MILFIAATFLAVSADDLIWLPCLLAACQRRAWATAGGYIVGTLVLDLVCWMAAHLLRGQDWLIAQGAWLPEAIGAGFVIYGVMAVWSWYRKGAGLAANGAPIENAMPRAAPFVAGLLAVFANGWNNLLLLPVIFMTAPGDQLAVVLGLAACNAGWAAVALGTLNVVRRYFDALFGRYGQAFAGAGFVAVGIKICVA